MQRENLKKSRTQSLVSYAQVLHTCYAQTSADVPDVQLAAHTKSGTLCVRSYGRKSKFVWLDGLLLFRIIMGLGCTHCELSYNLMARAIFVCCENLMLGRTKASVTCSYL